MGRRSVIILIALFLVSAVSASSLGTYTSEKDKEIDTLETAYKIGAFNMGEEAMDVKVSSTVVSGEADDISVVHPTTVRLQPTSPTSKTSGEGPWFSVGEEGYVRVKEIPVRVYVDERRSSNSFRFKVSLEGRAVEQDIDSKDGTALQSISQVRSYNYNLDVKAPRKADSGGESNPAGGPQNTQNQKFFQDSLEKAKQTFSRFVGDEGQDDQQDNQQSDSGDTGSESPQEGTDQEGGGTQDSTQKSGDGSEGKSSPSTGNFLASTGPSMTTLVMLIIFIFSSLYLMRVIGVV